jgi:hypothetical protein
MVVVGYEIAGRSMAVLQAFYAGRRPRYRRRHLGWSRLHFVLRGVPYRLRKAVAA